MHSASLRRIAKGMRHSAQFAEFDTITGGIGCYFGFEDSASAWTARGRLGTGVDLEVSLPIESFAYDSDQVESIFARSLDLALSSLFPGLPRLDSLDVAPLPVPLVRVCGVPCFGGSGERWHRQPDVDAFAKAARVVSDLVEPVLASFELDSDWPAVEVVPKPGASPGLRVGPRGRQFEFGVPIGFSAWDAAARADFALCALMEALNAYGRERGHDWRVQTEALSSVARNAEFTVRWRTARLKLQRQRGWAWADYYADADGGRVRVVLEGLSQRPARSKWVPAGCGARAARTIIPIQDIEETPAGVQLRVPGQRGRARFNFERDFTSS